MRRCRSCGGIPGDDSFCSTCSKVTDLETVGDQYELDCPSCGEPGFNDLWDGGLSGIGLDGDTVAWCSYCEKECFVVVETSVTCKAILHRKEQR